MHFDVGREFQLIHVLEHSFHNEKWNSNFGHEIWSEAFRLGEGVHIQQPLLAHLNLHFASSGIDLYFAMLSGFFHQ